MFFLEHIWIIPLLPAFGAAMMLFFGRKLSGIAPKPQANSWHPDEHSHDADHGPSPAETSHDVHAAHGVADAHHDAHGVHERHSWVSAICVGVVVLAFLWAVAAVWQYTQVYTVAHPGQPFEKIVYTWLGS